MYTYIDHIYLYELLVTYFFNKQLFFTGSTCLPDAWKNQIRVFARPEILSASIEIQLLKPFFV